jgi:putative methylase
MQKRLTRKLDLEILLSNIKPHPTPNPNLEQYTISSSIAAQMLYMAAYTYGDIEGKTVLDLGCGTGRLALGAVFLGAKTVVGVDLDRIAVKVAAENSANTELKDRVQWITADIDAVCTQFDTVLQNPPFGVQKRGADRKFIEKALKLGKAIYSLHKSAQDNKVISKKLKTHRKNTLQATHSAFLRSFIERNGGDIKAVYPMVMSIPYMFSFHTKRKHEFAVDLYVIERRTS